MPVFVLVANEESSLRDRIIDREVRFCELTKTSDFERAIRAINFEIRRAEEPTKIILSAHGGIDKNGIFKFGAPEPMTVRDLMSKIDQRNQPLILDLYACHAGKLFNSTKNTKIAAQDSEYYSILSNRTDNFTLSLNAGSKEKMGELDDYVIERTLDFIDETTLLTQKTLLPFTSKNFVRKQNGQIQYYKTKPPKIDAGEDYNKLSDDNIKAHITNSLQNLTTNFDWNDLNFDEEFYSFYRYNALCEKVLAFNSPAALSSKKRFEIKNYIQAIQTFNPYGFILTDSDTSSISSLTPLFIAAESGNLEIIDLLLKTRGVNINQTNKQGFSPLRIAAERGHFACAKYLIENGANVNLADNQGVTPLLISTNNGHYEIVKLLLGHRANVNQASRNGLTSARLALNKGHQNIFDLLLINGATIDYAGNQLKIAVLRKNDTAANSLFKAGAINDDEIYDQSLASCSKENTKLMALATRNKEVRTQIIRGFNQKIGNQENQITSDEISSINSVCDYRFKTFTKINPLRVAFKTNNFDIAEFLIKRGIEANFSPEDSSSYLALAAQNNYAYSLNFLLNNGANVNQTDDEGMSALIWSVINGNNKIAKTLLKSGATNDVNPYLSWNFECNNKQSLILLALATKDQNTRSQIINCFNSDSDEQDQISESEIEELDKILRNKQTDPDFLLTALKTHSPNIAKFLIDEDNLNIQDTNGSTPLILAVQNNYTELTSLLLKKGAAVNQANKYGSSPLMIALQNQNAEIATLLVKKGADINQDNGQGFTPLRIAQEFPNRNKLVELLENKKPSASSAKSRPEKLQQNANSRR